LRTHYDLLGIQPTAAAEEVKRAFRREIARYHPDKVQHLGSEFQEIAATRAAALTEAYGVLMDAELRLRYDEALAEKPRVSPPGDPVIPTPTTVPVPAPRDDAPPVDRRFSKEQAGTTDFVRRAVTARIRDAVTSAGGTVTTAAAIDMVCRIRGRKNLFSRSEPTVTMAVCVVPLVDAAAVHEAWGPVLRLAAPGETLCLMLLGSRIAQARELAVEVSDLRKKTRKAGPIVIPIDLRDWEALFPPETPAVVRALVERLRQGD
jgi:hypothetical protein